MFIFFFQAEDGIRDADVTGVQTCALPLTKAVFHDPRIADEAWVNAIVAAWKPRERRKAYMATGFALRRRDAWVAADLGLRLLPMMVLSGRHDVHFPWK